MQKRWIKPFTGKNRRDRSVLDPIIAFYAEPMDDEDADRVESALDLIEAKLVAPFGAQEITRCDAAFLALPIHELGRTPQSLSDLWWKGKLVRGQRKIVHIARYTGQDTAFGTRLDSAGVPAFRTLYGEAPTDGNGSSLRLTPTNLSGSVGGIAEVIIHEIAHLVGVPGDVDRELPEPPGGWSWWQNVFSFLKTELWHDHASDMPSKCGL